MPFASAVFGAYRAAYHAAMETTPTPALPVAMPVKRSLTRRALGLFHQHYWRLAWWKKLLLVLAVVLGVVGATGSVGGFFRPDPPEMKQAQATVESLAVPAGVALTPQQQVQIDQAKAKVDEFRHWFYDKTAPHLWRMGLGFFVMFVIGYAFRQFVKTMAVIAALLLAAVGVAAYLGAFELGHFRQNLTHSTGWAMDQVAGLKDLILKFAAASLSGTAGFVIGFMRR